MAPLCRIDMLGGLQVHIDGRTINRFQTQKTGALLAYLALYPQRPHARESVAELLWPNDEPIAIRNRLNQAVSSLRRQVHPPGVEPGTVMVTDNHKLTINTETVETDVDLFRRHVRQAAIEDDPARQIQRLRAAIDLYKGELLAGYYEEWAMTERLFLHEEFLESLDRLIRLLVEAGVPDEAIRYIDRRIASDPLDEAAHIRAMKLYMRLGRPRAALRQFAALERLLFGEGERPSELATTLAAEARAAVAEPAHDIDSWQVSETQKIDIAQEPEPLPTPGGKVRPAPPKFFTRFVGRSAEMERLGQLLGDPQSRVISILGPGGCGKTRLATEAVAAMGEGTRSIWISLSPIQDPSEVTGEVARLLAGSREPVENPEEVLADALGGGEPTILVLDNLEHLLHLGDIDLEPFLHLGEDVTILTTTRQPMGRFDEVILQLHPLPVPDEFDGMELAELLENPSIDLFVSRAQNSRQDFQLTERTAGSIATLCRRLEGIPLAIELAAGWARTMTPAQMVEEVDRRIDFLATRKRDIAERHRSMRSAFDSSFDLLPPSLQTVFLQCAVFVDGWTHEAARAVTGDDEIEVDLAYLEERSMITSIHDGAAIRFAMLELFRAYAKAKTSPELEAEALDRHAAYFAGLVRAGSQLKAGLGAQRLDPEIGNARRALDRLVETGQSEQAIDLAASLGGYWQYRARYDEGLETLQAVEKAFGESRPAPAAILRLRIAALASAAGRYDIAETMLAKAKPGLDAKSASRDALFEARLLEHFAAARKGSKEAETLLDAIVSDAKKQDLPEVLAEALRRRGESLAGKGKTVEAFDAYESALAAARSSDTEEAAARIKLDMAALAVETGQYDMARIWIVEAEEAVRWLGRPDLVCRVALAAMQLDLAAGRFDDAIEQGLAAFEGACWESGQSAEAMASVAALLAELGRPIDAARLAGFAVASTERQDGELAGANARRIEAARTRVGADLDEESLRQHWQVGRCFSPQQAAQIARTALQACREQPKADTIRA